MRRKALCAMGLFAASMVAFGILMQGCQGVSPDSRQAPEEGSAAATGDPASPIAPPPGEPEPVAGFEGLESTFLTAKLRSSKTLIARGGGGSATSSRPEAIPGALPSLEEELWVIEKAPEGAPIATAEDSPGCGALLARLPGKDEGKEVPVPLKHTDVKASLSGYIATVDVRQEFFNPYDAKIEAIYVFPLPENAAVNDFLMTVGERTIRGIIREREEARRIYEEAKSQGYVASLLTQERPNIFKQHVANIEPGKRIDIHIRYFHTLAYVDGWYEFVFPMVVGPRFNPPYGSDGIGAVARGQQGISGQATEIQYLKPGERSGHDISVAVDIDAGVKIEEIACPTHATTKRATQAETAQVALSPLDTIPNKDFVLRYKVAGKVPKSSLLTQLDERGGFFTLMIYPPEDHSELKRQPVELVFVLDCSGSMNGQPLAKAKNAMERALGHLEPDDTFQIVRFSETASQMGSRPIRATRENVRNGLRYLKSLESEGGTMMISGIRAALGFPHDPERMRIVSFMTDGYIGNEAEILAEIHKAIGASRIFSFGVGSSVNRYLLAGMAKIGRGAVAYVTLNESGSEKVDQFYERIRRPALADIEIDWGGMRVREVFPKKIPDLFVGRPVIVTGRFEGELPGELRVTGKIGGDSRELAVPVASLAHHAGIPSVWARMKIADLADQSIFVESSELPEEIKQTALEYNLVSAYTSFVAVDSLTRTAGEYGTTVPVAVPVPDGVRYKTNVQER